MDSLSDLLLSINEKLEADSALRETIQLTVKELDRQVRALHAVANRVHSTPPAELERLARQIEQGVRDVAPTLKEIGGLIPQGEFFKWSGLYNKSLQDLTFLAALAHFLLYSSLISLAEVSEMLALDESLKDRITLLPDDYLQGLISLINEQSRLAVNSVTLGNFQIVERISTFVGEIFSGFALLNLKNDSLRRRFDAIKYSVKRVEEVRYDLSIRGLGASPVVTAPTETDKPMAE